MLEPVFQHLADHAAKWRTVQDWPRSSLEICGRQGIFRGLSGLEISGSDSEVRGGQAWSTEEQTRVLMRLAESDLLTTFVITQHLGAIKRILVSDRLSYRTPSSDSEADQELAEQILPRLLEGSEMASVGISHLTTSRRHLGRPAVAATEVHGGYRLEGTIPWVTGAPEVKRIVVGATLPDEDEILVLLSTEQAGVETGPGAPMIAMSASCTDQVVLQDVFVDRSDLLSGPRPNVLSTAKPSAEIPRDATSAGSAPTGAGGLQTSVLAIGLSFAALSYLQSEAERRENLIPIVKRFEEEHQTLREQILSAAAGISTVDSGAIRKAANSLVQRTTSAAMTTAKGAGLMIDHPVGRWCSQAFFFLVWSCPQPVAEAHLCDLVGLEQ